MPARHRVAVVPGDGVGPEVVTHGCLVLERAASLFGFEVELDELPWGSGYHRAHGRMMPADGVDRLLGMVKDPWRFKVLVASNLFGDILSDLGAALGGSIGCSPSANLHPGRHPNLFEPVHGSAPDLAGRGIANPVGAVWSASMLLEDLGEREAAAAVLEAIERVLEAGVHTPDLGGRATTDEVGESLVRAIEPPETGMTTGGGEAAGPP